MKVAVLGYGKERAPLGEAKMHSFSLTVRTYQRLLSIIMYWTGTTQAGTKVV